MAVALRRATAAGAQGPSRRRKSRSKGGATVTIGDQKINISPAVREGLSRSCSRPSKRRTLRASRPRSLRRTAAAKTGDEHFLASQAELKVAVAQKNEAGIGTAIEGLIASGSLPQDQLGGLYTNLGKIRYNLKQFPQAIAAFEKAQQLEPEQCGDRPASRPGALGRRQSQRRGGDPAPGDRPAERQRRKGARGHVQAGDFACVQVQAGGYAGAQPPVGERLSDGDELERRDPHLSQPQQCGRCGDARPAPACAGGQGTERRSPTTTAMPMRR